MRRDSEIQTLILLEDLTYFVIQRISTNSLKCMLYISYKQRVISRGNHTDLSKCDRAKSIFSVYFNKTFPSWTLTWASKAGGSL